MIKSMTGYGRAEKQFEKYKIIIEAKSVNNRYLDIDIRTYKQYIFLEEVLRECISSALSRGKISVFLQIETTDSNENLISLNESTAVGYLDAMKKIAALDGVKDDISVSSFLRLPDIFSVEKNEEDKDALSACVKEVACEALNDLTLSRENEGCRLKTFFETSIENIKSILEIIETCSPQTVKEYEQKLKERIKELLDGVDVDETRILTEVGIFADKVNITEEITRFKSHLAEFSSLLNSDIPIGRKLDFIIQELNREANTMGSKCNDITVSKSVVELKSEIEKLREQVQNIE
ncbi:MAG: YicC/YloC family endoribonuclease [Clostridia bacterium]|nr:YicC/YloC family endoribonuclease [Clostridia bacterium]